MKKISLIIFVSALLVFVFNSCKKFDLPPKKAIPPVSGNITIDSIIKKYENYYLAGSPSTLFKFPNDVNLTCTITADEVSGNLYKTVFAQDATGTIQIKLINSGGLYIGDLIRINLNGAILDDYAKMIQLDSIDIEKRVVKISTGNTITPTKMTMTQMLSLNTFGLAKYQGKLILLDSVEFDVGSKNQLFSDPVGKTVVDRTLIDSHGQSVTVRTSGYANFAGNYTPCGKGSFIAVLSQYNNTFQLYIRNIQDVTLSGGNCPYLAKNFEDGSLTGGGWSIYNVSGNICWTIGTTGGNYANISNYAGGSNIFCETWFISPPINLSASSNPVLSFISAYNYTGPALQVYVSTNYNSGSPVSATWTALNPTLSSGNWAWTSSGNLSLSAYKTSNVRFGFKYTGTSSAGSTWEIDNIAVVEN